MNAGGAERVASILANAWSRRGDQVDLMPTYSWHGDCFYELSPNVNLVYLADLVPSLHATFVNQLVRLRALRRFITVKRPDVIVSFLSNVNVAAVLASLGLGVPVIVCERTDPFMCPISFPLRIARRITYPLADVVTVQTEAVATKLLGVNRRLWKVRVVPNPIPEINVETQRCISAGKNKRLLAVGRLSEEKQFSLLINTFFRLSHRHPQWSLRILGDGPLRAVLQQQIIELKMNDRIELPGRTPDVMNELAQADAFVLTSRFEGFPNALLEAMAVGVPSVSFDCPSGPREMSMNGTVAMLVAANDQPALEDAINRLMSDDDLRVSLGSRGRASVIDRFTLDKILGKWDAVFAEVGAVRSDGR